MPGRGGASAKRRLARGASAPDGGGSNPSEEVAALANSLRELAAIRTTAEEAASRILDSAETLLACADRAGAKRAEEQVLAIMTACGFHDLVGQRVTKIAKTLDLIIAARTQRGMGKRTGSNRQAATAPRLEGPGHPGTSADQAAIDALFKDA